MTDSRSPKPSLPAQQERPEGPAGAGKEGSAEGAARPPGEVGGHTVQPWEQDPVPTTTTPNSKDVPPPQAGTKEAVAQGTGQGMRTTAAPGNDPSSADPGEAAPEGYSQTLAQQAERAATPDAAAEAAPAAEEKAPGLTRPSRPPVYKPQNGHEPAPRPPPNQVVQAKAKGPATEGDALVNAITKAIAENLAKAFHQSVAQAVRDFMPLSGRTLAQPKVDVGAQLTKAPPKAKEPKAPAAAKAPEGKAASAAPQPPAETGPAAAKPAQADPSAQSNYGEQPKASQYGGTIEAPDEQAKARLAAASNPNNPDLGKAAAESADRETREGNLV